MSKFLVLYRSSVSAREQMANATPEQAQAGMQAWMDWANASRDAIVDLGAPLGEGRSVPPDSAAGAASEVGGFSILQADSADALVALLGKHPHLRMPGGASIEVHEFLPMPGA